jgi:hypothetical protein
MTKRSPRRGAHEVTSPNLLPLVELSDGTSPCIPIRMARSVRGYIARRSPVTACMGRATGCLRTRVRTLQREEINGLDAKDTHRRVRLHAGRSHDLRIGQAHQRSRAHRTGRSGRGARASRCQSVAGVLQRRGSSGERRGPADTRRAFFSFSHSDLFSRSCPPSSRPPDPAPHPTPEATSTTPAPSHPRATPARRRGR